MISGARSDSMAAMSEPRFKDVVDAINFLEDEVIVTGVQGEAWDIVKQHLLAKRMCEAHEWTSAEIGALMMAATEATDVVQRLSTDDSFFDYEGLTDKITQWRKAVSRES